MVFFPRWVSEWAGFYADFSNMTAMSRRGLHILSPCEESNTGLGVMTESFNHWATPIVLVLPKKVICICVFFHIAILQTHATHTSSISWKSSYQVGMKAVTGITFLRIKNEPVCGLLSWTVNWKHILWLSCLPQSTYKRLQGTRVVMASGCCVTVEETHLIDYYSKIRL